MQPIDTISEDSSISEDIADDSSEALYLLGLSVASSADVNDSIRHGYEQLEVVTLAGVDAWLVRVDRGEFEGARGEKNLSDIAWLGPRAMAHQLAIEHLSAHVAFLPMRFGTLFSCIERLTELIESNVEPIGAFLAQVGQQAEWGLKCFVDWERAVELYQRENGGQASASAGVGTNYLLKKRMVRDRDEAIRGWLQTRLETSRGELEQIVCGQSDRGLSAADRGSSVGECVANWSLLLADERQADLAQLVEQWNAGDASENALLQWQLTGPWPPYSFVPPLSLPAADD